MAEERVTQFAIEVITVGAPNARLTQMVIEIIQPYTPPSGFQLYEFVLPE
jgi:hypothetical protein